eukprot:g1549.t1
MREGIACDGKRTKLRKSIAASEEGASGPKRQKTGHGFLLVRSDPIQLTTTTGIRVQVPWILRDNDGDFQPVQILHVSNMERNDFAVLIEFSRASDGKSYVVKYMDNQNMKTEEGDMEKEVAEETEDKEYPKEQDAVPQMTGAFQAGFTQTYTVEKFVDSDGVTDLRQDDIEDCITADGIPVEDHSDRAAAAAADGASSRSTEPSLFKCRDVVVMEKMDGDLRPLIDMVEGNDIRGFVAAFKPMLLATDMFEAGTLDNPENLDSVQFAVGMLIADNVFHAMKALFNLGWVYTDVKPENVLVMRNRDEAYQLTDKVVVVKLTDVATLARTSRSGT